MLWLGVGAVEADDTSDRDDEMVCVPSEDGRRWECGTRANPPPERELPVLPRTGYTAPPPPFLTAPGPRSAPPTPPTAEPPRRRRDEFPAAPPRSGGAEVTAAPDPAPAAIEALPETPSNGTQPPASAPEASARTVDAPSDPPRADPVPSAPSPPPMLAAPRPRVAPYAPVVRPTTTVEPGPANTPATTAATLPVASGPVAAEPVATEPVATEPVATEPVAAKPVAAESVATEPAAAEPVAAEAVAAQPAATEPVAAAPMAEPSAGELPAPTVKGSSAFLALAPTRFTLQVARASRVESLRTVARDLRPVGLDGHQGGAFYIVTVDTGGTPQSLLLWGDFSDAEAARAAWAALPDNRPTAYARRIAPLQDEIRRSTPVR